MRMEVKREVEMTQHSSDAMSERHTIDCLWHRRHAYYISFTCWIYIFVNLFYVYVSSLIRSLYSPNP